MNFLDDLKNMVLNGNGDSDKHALSLYSIALSLGAKNILELGVRGGATTLPLLLAAHHTGGTLESVDINETNFKVPHSYLEPHWKFIKSDALKYLEKCASEKRKFELIYIDDWHSYDHVSKELYYVDMLVSPSSVVLLHDLMYGGTEPFYHTDLTRCSPQWSGGGPYRAVAELDNNFWEFATIPVNNGLTILRKKYSSKYFGR